MLRQGLFAAVATLLWLSNCEKFGITAVWMIVVIVKTNFCIIVPDI